MNFSLLNSYLVNFGFYFSCFFLVSLVLWVFAFFLFWNKSWIESVSANLIIGLSRAKKHQCFYLTWSVRCSFLIFQCSFQLFFGSPGETTLRLHVMFWFSFVLNVVTILFSTIGCRMSATSFSTFIPCLCEDFGLVVFWILKLHVLLNVQMLHKFAFDSCWKKHEVLKNLCENVCIFHTLIVYVFSVPSQEEQARFCMRNEKWFVKISLSLLVVWTVIRLLSEQILHPVYI